MFGKCVLILLVALLSQVHAFGTLCSGNKRFNGNVHNTESMPENFKVAFYGDQGIKDSSRLVLQQAVADGVEMFWILGDFDYESDPEAWISMLDEELGTDFPVFASIGNHDLRRWNQYEEELWARYERTNITQYCEGEIGVKMTCNYKGLYFITSGVGTWGVNHDDYFDKQLSEGESIWKICGWHKNHRKYQTGNKFTEVPIEMYEVCRRHGAIVATGHEHSYARTHLMSSFEDFEVVNEDNTLQLSLNNSFCFCSGLGGQSVRNWDNGFEDNYWWAATAASDNGATDGPLICTFNVNGDPRAAECYFRDTNGKVFDTFNIYTNLEATKNEPLGISAVSFKEYPVRSSKQDQELNGAVDAEILSVFGQNHVRLSFENVLEDAMKSEFEAVRLQVYGSEDGLTPKMLIRGVLPDGSLTKVSVMWDKEDDDFEGVTVWVSVDLSSILKEVLANGATGEFTLDIFGADGKAKFYSFDHSPCLAPTLSIDYSKKH